jgi:hypothetical protein
LKTPEIVEIDPAIDVFEAGRQLATPIASPAIDVGGRAGIEVFDDHVEHTDLLVS